MPTFIDESGDPGWERDSTPYFTLAAVWFQTPEQSFACEEVIAEVRARLALPPTFEFKFARINHDQKVAFLTAVASCPFSYFTCTIEKHRKGKWLEGRQWQNKGYFYERVVEPVVGSLSDYLLLAELEKGSPLNERVTYDEHTDPQYVGALREQMKKPKAASGRSLVKKVRRGKSKVENLLQLADMVCGSVVHSIYNSGEYEALIKVREGARHRLP
jgi:hypothetical protein